MKFIRAIAVVSVLFSMAGFASAETSDVLRFTLPEVVGGRWDMEVILFHRDGDFHHGYARVLRRDNVSHRVDVTPSRPIQWVKSDGTKLDVPDTLRGYYSYKRPEFKRMRALYAQGKIKISYPIPTPPVAWKNGKLTGHLDVLISPVNVSNGTGRSSSDTAYRIRLDAEGRKGGSVTGSAVWWTYEEKDDDYGADSGKSEVKLARARWDGDFWAARKGTTLAVGKTWPQARGPMLTGAAVDCERGLVDNLDDARLLWVGEETIGGGRGAVLSRGGFAMYPYAWQNIGYGGFAGVTVADGKVFQYVLHPDEQLVAANEKISQNVYVELGADPRTMANEHGLLRDTVLCLDARTGKRLWWFKSEKTFGNVKSGKGGIGMTACYHDGKVYARGHRGLYCLDGETGKLLWKKSSGQKGEKKIGYGPSHGWSHDESPVMIGGILVMGFGKEEGLAGVSPDDGRLLWAHTNVKGQNAVATKVAVAGTEHIIVCSKETAKLSLIEPRTGKILWQSDLLGPNHGPLLVSGDVVCGNNADRKKTKFGIAGAVRVSRQGAKRAWVSQAAYPPARAVPVAHKGFFYIDTRRKFYCLGADTGSLAGLQPHIYKMSWGSHNWTWTITSNRKVFTSGVLMFSTADDGFAKLPGRIALDLAGGYTCPIKPAIADGRLFCRLADRIVCYDLRKPDDLQAATLKLSAPDAFTSSLARNNTVTLRVRSTNRGVPRISASWPKVVGPEAEKIAEKWVAWYKKPLRRRTYPAPNLNAGLQTGKLTGKAKVPMGWHFEYWTFDGVEDGIRAVRSLPAVKNPLKVSGEVTGRSFKDDDGRVYVLNLQKAATQLQRSDKKQTVTVVVVDGDKGRRAWAVAGRINGMAHEADPSELTIKDGKISGKVTVLFRDDPYFHLNADEWTGVAATYEVNAEVKGKGLSGRHSGTMGHAWSKTIDISVEIERAP